MLNEYLVKNIMENFPEASSGSSLRCLGWHYDKWKYIFEDEDEVVYKLGKKKLLAAVPSLFTDKWSKGLTPVPQGLLLKKEVCDDWLCQADAIDFDAYIQLVIFGEVIYG